MVELQPLMSRRTLASISFYGVLASNVVVLLLPLLLIVAGSLWTGTPLSSIAREPESRGFLTLYCAAACILHAPLMIVLGLFAHAVGRVSPRRVNRLYVLALTAMSLSALYYVRWFISFPCVKYLPALFYLFVLAPFLSLGLLATRPNAARHAQ